MSADDPRTAAPLPDPREVEESLLSALALDELTSAERARIEARLAVSAADRIALDELRAIGRALRGSAPAGEPSAVLRAAVVAALGEAPATKRSRSPRSAWPWLLALGAVAASVVVVIALPGRVAGERQVAWLGREPEPVTASDGAPAPAAAPEPTGGERRQSGAAVVAATPVTEVDEKAAAAPVDRESQVHGKRLESFAFAPADAPGLAAQAESARPMATFPARSGAPGGGVGSGVATPGYFGTGLGGAARLEAPGHGGREAEEFAEAGLFRRGRPMPAGERFARFVENPFQDPQTAPLSTFSIDVDTASYTIVRRFLAAGQRPPADAVRLEELVNYFRYADPPPPAGGDPFAVRLETAASPWRPEHRLVRVALKGREIAAATRPAGNLVFLVDVSGSMRDPDKLPLVKQALLLLVDQLREEDRVSIVTYAGDAGLKLPATGGDRPEAIRGVIRSLDAGGSTHGSAGIELAYEEAKRHFVPGGANRVILCTDGDLNVGITDDAALVKLIRAKAAEGTFLTVLGFGQGNLQDEKMEKLADNGNGLYAYVDSVREARKVLVEQLTGSTVTIAKDVKIQVEFNPALVASYRLLGYENRVMATRDFADDTKDAGEIGAGHGVTALYEYVPAGADAGQPAELKYGPRLPVRPRPEAEGPASRELLTVKLRYKQPEGRDSVEREFPLVDAGGSFDSASDDLRFASAVAAFGMLLRDSAHAGDATLPRVAEIAGGAIGADPGGLRAEFLDLVRLAGGVRPPRE
ncbi:MAG: VWA domain-containing protein [Planctomycetes bacterium]|nr:VWA domain-containing protein [Planctomycetota bacterium]MBM4056657.1 VWA domain-containing protein [Planctomycetota bacterium]